MELKTPPQSGTSVSTGSTVRISRSTRTRVPFARWAARVAVTIAVLVVIWFVVFRLIIPTVSPNGHENPGAELLHDPGGNSVQRDSIFGIQRVPHEEPPAVPTGPPPKGK